MENIITYSIAHSTGALKDKPDRRDFKIVGIQSPVELPESFRLPDSFPIKDQNGFGSCTAQSTSTHKQLQENVELSARFLYAMTKKLEENMQWGAYTRNTFKVLCNTGIIEESEYPERHDIPELAYMDWNLISIDKLERAKAHKSKTYWRVNSDFESIKQAIYQNKQAVVISVPWYESYNYAPDGYLKLNIKKGWKYGHAICVVGWIKDCLVVKNSWGDNWGLNGMCYFYKDYPIWDGWVSIDLSNLPVELRYGQPRNYAMEKAIAFNPWLIKKIKRLPSNIEINALWYGKHSFDTVFKGINADAWLQKTKPQLIKEGFNYK